MDVNMSGDIKEDNGNESDSDDGGYYGLFGATSQDTSSSELRHSEEIPNNATIDVNACVICVTSLGKYKCPSCERRTCSVSCCDKHKKKYSCSGKRSKTTYTELKDMNQTQFMSDYQFLEDVSRVIDVAARDRKNVIRDKTGVDEDQVPNAKTGSRRFNRFNKHSRRQRPYNRNSF